ncbi:electron transport complex subunit RsxC [Paludicola sp. MB14-C6]|uniref:electron transport complex subunit RsxC n=1 Tax=Paludihabitans sp. MB14-C6 TaxID=3070656 RepID=UPI0027DDAAAD|nr:electron transport complex subunit RsxC [Paludicola sp. MB14-C6]WMJ23305.1 electron transport complex subunit RsxC [Paludicola sp. MB14-C6]
MPIIKSKKSLHGALVSHCKKSKDNETETIPIPSKVKIPMIQHMGAPCSPLVKVGDQVYVGQKIGESPEYFSVPIHASCSGVVKAIEDFNTPMGVSCKSVVIETDGQQTVDPEIKVPTANNKDEFITAVKESGLVGLGGAGFPTFIKLAYKDIDSVKNLVINAAECEPYITADYRECLESTQNIVEGINLVKKHLNIENIYIGVEDNKPEAVQVLNKAFHDSSDVKIVRLKTIYPQGAEKSIIYATCGIVVEEGKLPADHGVIVLNISTVGFIGSYMKTGMPLVSKRITVDGDFVSNPKNLRVPIGIDIQTVLEYCNIKEEYGKVLMGGPMMGITVNDTLTPIIKNNNAIIVLSKEASIAPPTTACIRCGKCIAVCPLKLMPAKLEKAYDNKNVELLNELHISLCINCGCCTYICPAKRHLAQKNQLAKALVRNK